MRGFTRAEEARYWQAYRAGDEETIRALELRACLRLAARSIRKAIRAVPPDAATPALERALRRVEAVRRQLRQAGRAHGLEVSANAERQDATPNAANAA